VKHHAAGFTLLEMMVALVVLGFLILGLSQGVRFGLAAHRTQLGLLAKAGGLDAVDRTLRGLITRMDPGGFDAPPTLAGGPDRMAFVTELPAGAATDGLRQAEVALSVDAAHEFVLAWRLAPHALALRPPPRGRVVLLHDVDRIAISYLAPENRGWVRRWGATTLPDLVRLRIIFRRGDPRLWPDIVARPMRARPP
jgi:general secretion pathway protein J